MENTNITTNTNKYRAGLEEHLRRVFFSSISTWANFDQKIVEFKEEGDFFQWLCDPHRQTLAMINDHLRGLFLQFIWVFVLCYHQRREDLRVLVYVWKAVYSLLQRRDWTWTRSLFKLFHVPASVKQVSSAPGPNEKGVFEFWVHKSNKKKGLVTLVERSDVGWMKDIRYWVLLEYCYLVGKGGGDWALPSALPKAPGHDSNPTS